MPICVCVRAQALQLKVGQERDLLQTFSGEDQTSSDVVSQAQMLIQTCEDLRSQVNTSVTPSALIFRSTAVTSMNLLIGRLCLGTGGGG